MSRTKEDIISKYLADVNLSNYDATLKAMDEYAKQQAVLFAEWMDKSGYCKLENGCWGSLSDFKDDKTTEDLYDISTKKYKE